MNNREKATEIVEELRKHFKEFDSGVRYAFFGLEKDDNLIEDYKQSDIIHQVITIEILLDRGIDIEVIDTPVGMIENDKGDVKPLTIRSWKVEEDDMIDIEDDVKLIVFYMWFRLPEFKTDNGVKYNLIRMKTFKEEGYHLMRFKDKDNLI